MLIGTKRSRQASRRQSPYRTTTVRQFEGGWNVVDNELTLSPRYARVFDNVMRGTDGSVSVRPGYGLWQNLKRGIETVHPNKSFTIATTNGSRRVTVTWTAHGFSSGQHITLSGLATFQGIPASNFNTTHNIRVITPDTFDFIVPTAATGAGSTGIVTDVVHDIHIVGGRIVNAAYFQENIIAFTSAGEVVKVAANGSASVIWDNYTAYQLSGNPVGWSATEFVSYNSFGGKLLAHNGIDKPLEINLNNTPNVVFLGDPASGGSNAFVPIGRYGFTSNKFSIISGITATPSLVQFSATAASGVYVGNPAPADATDVDLAKVTSAGDTTITGITELRDKLLVTFKDAITIGTLGGTKTVGATTLHDPTFKDNIPQHGTVSHRTIVSLGNDVFMCDRVGVPSVALSQLSGQLIPDRVSELIEPVLQTNINRLSDSTLSNKAFAVFNSQERQYMLFMPKYDETDIRVVERDGLIFSPVLPNDEFIIHYANHGLDEGDPIEIKGSTDIGANTAATINGIWKVGSILDEDYFTVATGTAFVDRDVSGGGDSITFRPINQETIGYIYTFNPKLKVRSWARFRHMDFDWGLKTPGGHVFLGKGGKIYRLGSKLIPYYADSVGDYDKLSWQANTAYTKGTRIIDSSDGLVYIALLDHTSSNVASFADERKANSTRWEVYVGEPIEFAWEWPWADFDKRVKTKEVGAVYPDTYGSGQFNLEMFVDQIYRGSDGKLSPVRELTFVGGQSGGFGVSSQPFGAGRRSKEQLVWPVPTICKQLKLRVTGETTKPLRFVAMSIIYREGSYER